MNTMTDFCYNSDFSKFLGFFKVKYLTSLTWKKLLGESS